MKMDNLWLTSAPAGRIDSHAKPINSEIISQ